MLLLLVANLATASAAVFRAKDFSVVTSDGWERIDQRDETSEDLLIYRRFEEGEVVSVLIRKMPCDYPENLKEATKLLTKEVKEDRITRFGSLQGRGRSRTGQIKDGDYLRDDLFFPNPPHDSVVVMVFYWCLPKKAIIANVESVIGSLQTRKTSARDQK